MISKIIAAGLVVGSVSALSYALTIENLINSLFVASIVTVFYTELSQKYAEGDISQFVSMWKKGLATFLLILTPLAIFFFFNSIDIVTILLKRGSFTEESVKLTAIALSFYVLGVPFHGIRNLTLRIFYITNDAKTPMINGLVAIIVNITLSFLLSRKFAVGGIAFAGAVTALISCIILIISLCRKKMQLHLRSVVPTTLKIFIAGVIMSMTQMVVSYLLDDVIVRFLFSIILSFGLYFLTLIVLRCKEVIYIYDIIKRKIKNDE